MTTQPLGPLCQSIPEHRSYTSSPGIVPGWLPNPGDPLAEYPRTPELHRQSQDCPGMTTQPLGPLCQSIPERRSYTPAVPGLSRDDYPTPGTPLSEYPRTPELHWQSRDCPGMATQSWGPLGQSILERRSYTGSPGIVPGWLPNPGDPSGRVSQNTGVTPVVPGLSRDDYPIPWDPSVRVSPNAGVTPAVPGLSRDAYPTPWDPCEYSRTPELHRQSQDCPGMATRPVCQSIPERQSYTGSPGMTTQPLGHSCQSIPEHRSYTSSPGIVLGWLPNPWDLSSRVSQNAGVTPCSSPGIVPG